MLCKKFQYIKDECAVCGGKGYLFNDDRKFVNGQEQDFAKQCDCMTKMVKYCKYDEANIPMEYFDLSLDDFKETSVQQALAKRNVKAVIDNIDKYAREGKSLFIYGKKGTGKTMLAMEILKAAINKGHSVYYNFYPLVFHDFTKKGYEQDNIKAAYDKMFVSKDFLVLDELVKERDYFGASAEQNEEMSKRFLEMNILKRRSSKSTIFISNIKNGLDDIQKYYGPYVASMISHKFEFIDLSDDKLPDFRMEGKQK
jgi:DNA replication protein DnaC